MRLSLLLFLLSLTACTSDGGNTQQISEPVDASAGFGPFVPAHMRIFPLTHVETQGDPRTPGSVLPRIVCHLEFTDRWHDTVKAAGLVEVLLYRSGGAGFDVQQARWDVDLSDLSANADWFDPVTRTYRLQLNLPDWAKDTLGPTCRLTVTFTLAGQEPGRATMRDEITLRTGGPGVPMPENVGFPESVQEFRPKSDPPKPVEPKPAAPAKNDGSPR